MPISLEDNTELIKKVLSGAFTPVIIKHISITESISCGLCSVSMYLEDGTYIECEGLGMVDAVFNGLKKEFFYSLEKLTIQKFEAKAVSKSLDSEVIIYVQIKNSYGNLIDFEDRSKSLISSATKICARITEYFINSHKAYLVLSKALEEAKERNRQDLIERYVRELSLIVQSTGYEKEF